MAKNVDNLVVTISARRGFSKACAALAFIAPILPDVIFDALVWCLCRAFLVIEA